MKKIALHIILLISFFRIYAQEVEFVASVDKNPVPVGEMLTLLTSKDQVLKDLQYLAVRCKGRVFR